MTCCAKGIDVEKNKQVGKYLCTSLLRPPYKVTYGQLLMLFCN